MTTYMGSPIKGTVLLATLGERDTIEFVLQEIAESCLSLKRFGWDLDVLVVDDSKDPNFASDVEHLTNRIHLPIKVIRGPGSGLGAAILHGFTAALDDPDIEFIVNLDADGQHDGRQIGDLLRAHRSSTNAITIGSRWTRGGRCYGLSPLRKVISRLSSLALRTSGVPWHVKDPTTSFRVYSRKSIEAVSRDLVGFDGFSFFGAAIAIAHRSGLSIGEVPIHFRPRLAGKSNLKVPQIVRAVKDLRQIRPTSSMVYRRIRDFTSVDPAVDDASNYSARRELEALSATPTSTELILKEFENFLGDSILEVGAGLGHITKSLASRGKRVLACEPDARLADQLAKNLQECDSQFFQGTTSDLIAKDVNQNREKFDTAIYVNVLEHIEDDINELSRLQLLMKPGATIIIFVPALPSLYGTMDSLSGHFRRYRKTELTKVVELAGLELQNSWHFDVVGVFPYWLLYRILRVKHLGGSSVFIYDKIIIPTSKVLSIVSNRKIIGKNLIAIAKVRDKATK